MGDDLDLALASLLDLDVLTKVTNATVNLDLVLEELLEGGNVEDLVASGLLSVDDELTTSISTWWIRDTIKSLNLPSWWSGSSCPWGRPSSAAKHIDLSLLLHAMISLGLFPVRLGQQQSGVIYILW